jgi:argininosuccinate synthase
MGSPSMIKKWIIRLRGWIIITCLWGFLCRTYRAVESICMGREAMHLRDGFIPQYAKRVYNGFWFAPEREMLQAAITESPSSAMSV